MSFFKRDVGYFFPADRDSRISEGNIVGVEVTDDTPRIGDKHQRGCHELTNADDDTPGHKCEDWPGNQGMGTGISALAFARLSPPATTNVREQPAIKAENRFLKKTCNIVSSEAIKIVNFKRLSTHEPKATVKDLFNRILTCGDTMINNIGIAKITSIVREKNFVRQPMTKATLLLIKIFLKPNPVRATGNLIQHMSGQA